MSTELENILSGQREPAPAPEATTTQTAQPETTQEQPQGQPEPSSSDEPQTDERGMVPVAALQAERQKAKRYTEQVAEFQQKLEQQNAQWEARFAQMMNAVVPKQAQPEPAAAPSIWEDEHSFVRNEAQQIIDPLRQQNIALAREVAEIRYQPETVKEAEAAFNAAAVSGQLDPETYRRIQASPNPFAAAVQWHQHTQTMAEIGSDPAAYKAKLAEEIRAQVMAELQQGQQQPGAARPAPVTPSNFATGRNVGSRAGPAYAGPSPIDEILGNRR